MQHANITIAYNNSIILCIAAFRSQLNAARTTRQRSARVVVGSVLVPRRSYLFIQSIDIFCPSCSSSGTIQSWRIIPRFRRVQIPCGSRYFTLPHGCITFRNVIHMATSLSTCLLAPFIGLLPFALLLFTWLFFRLF